MFYNVDAYIINAKWGDYMSVHSSNNGLSPVGHQAIWLIVN